MECFLKGFGELRGTWSYGRLLERIWRVTEDLESGEGFRRDWESYGGF